MTPLSLTEAACAVLQSYAGMGFPLDRACVILIMPPRFRAPPKWPRSELLQVKDDGTRIVAVNAMKLLDWVSFALRSTAENEVGSA